VEQSLLRCSYVCFPFSIAAASWKRLHNVGTEFGKGILVLMVPNLFQIILQHYDASFKDMDSNVVPAPATIILL